jgi:hypothetical protein
MSEDKVSTNVVILKCSICSKEEPDVPQPVFPGTR